MHGPDEDETLLNMREQSHRAVQTAFSIFAILSIAAGLIVRHHASALGLAGMDSDAIAKCFLCMGTCYTATVFVWDWLFCDVHHDE